jgi:hypothetical protein
MSTLQDRFVFPPYPYVTICCNKKNFQTDYLNNLADVVESDVTLSTFLLFVVVMRIKHKKGSTNYPRF